MATETKTPKAARRKSRLVTGFDSLTLDPSPRLKRVREEMTQEEPASLEEAWRSVARAFVTAISDIGHTIKAGL